VPEWENIAAVKSLGINVAERVAVGERRIWGREVASFIMTEALYGAKSLEESAASLFSGKASGDVLKRERKLIDAAAAVGRELHSHCMYHQDFYLSHFFLGQADELYLIDLQRVIRRSSPSRRYMIKDLAQLNYSAETTGWLSRTDRLRFFVRYRGIDKLGPDDKALIRKIMAKSRRIAAHTVKLLERRRRRGELP
jgi:heptose I phosphotransferase